MKKIVVLVSGNGSNLQCIIEAVRNRQIRNTEIAAVMADRPCYALKRAEAAGLQTFLLPRGTAFSENLEKILPKDTALLVLAGFLSILSAGFCEKFPGKIINIHPALLPKFGGKGMWGEKVHKAVLESGEKQSGLTIHFVTAGIDEGSIIAQATCAVQEGETLDTLAKKVHALEHQLYPKIIDNLLNNNTP